MVLSTLHYYWRWSATAFSFFAFGLGGMLIPIIIVPILYCLPGGKELREQRGQKFIHYSFRNFIWMMRFLGVLTYDVTDAERLKDTQLILANHPSLLDVVFLISLVPNANCIVKSGLMRNLFMRGPISAAGYIVNAGDVDDVIIAANSAFEKGQAIIIFPEGTRTEPFQPIQLKRGAANIAVRSGANITPVLISCTPTTLTKSDRWYQIPNRRMHFNISVKEKIDITPYIDSEKYAKGARKLTQELTTYFNNEVGLNE